MIEFRQNPTVLIKCSPKEYQNFLLNHLKKYNAYSSFLYKRSLNRRQKHWGKNFKEFLKIILEETRTNIVHRSGDHRISFISKIKHKIYIKMKKNLNHHAIHHHHLIISIIIISITILGHPHHQ